MNPSNNKDNKQIKEIKKKPAVPAPVVRNHTSRLSYTSVVMYPLLVGILAVDILVDMWECPLHQVII